MGKISAGVVAGLIAGVVFGVMMQMMATPDGMPMIAMVAKVVRSDSVFVGWLYHLFNSAVIGGLFGWLVGNRIHGYGAGLGAGALNGVIWWILGALVLMPIFLGMAPFAPLMMAEMRSVAMGSLMGHLIYGLILGASFVALRHSAPGVIHEA
jgi:hypothetical protein